MHLIFTIEINLNCVFSKIGVSNTFMVDCSLQIPLRKQRTYRFNTRQMNDKSFRNFPKAQLPVSPFFANGFSLSEMHSVENIVAGVTFQFWAILDNFGQF